MVRLVQKEDVSRLADLLTIFFKFQKHHTHVIPVNYPDVGPCIYAMWHNHQCLVSGLPDIPHTNVMISRSKDGDVVASALERAFGFKTVRGSKARRGAVEATKQMIKALKAGEYGAIMVDGPRGPFHVVKDGVVKIAKLAGVPIVPVAWYSTNPNLIKLPSWDRLQMPVWHVQLVNLYGDPIYVPADSDDEADEKIRLQLQNTLNELTEEVPKVYEKVYWHGLWRRREK